MAEFGDNDDDDRVRLLEERLRDLLNSEPYASDDRKLARVYLALANLLRPRMNEELIGHLNFLNGDAPKEAGVLAELSRRLSKRSTEVRGNPVRPNDEFLYRLLESCAKPKFTIYPTSDVEPVGWAIGIGVPFEDVLSVVAREYPEISKAS